MFGLANSGRWSAMIVPLTRPRMELFLFKRSHATTAHAVYVNDTGGGGHPEAVKTYQVKFVLEEVLEGQLHQDTPTIDGPYIDMESARNDVSDFLRAIVNLAAEQGIYADVPKRTDDELKAVRYHLEDLRRLVFK